MSKKIIIASKNPVKINATLDGFKQMFPDESFSIEGVNVPSNVSDQPMTEVESMQGASNRANNAFEQYPDADYWVGMEGGVQKLDDGMIAYAWIYVKTKNLLGKARSSSYFLPTRIVELIEQGKELGHADDIVFGKSNSKQQNGAIGILTHDAITRTEMYKHALIMALIPFRNPELY